MNKPNSSHGALIALGATVLIWSYSWIVMKQALRYAGPFEFVALRYALGTVVLALVLLAMRRPLRPPALAGTIVVGLTQTAAFQGLSQLALTTGGVGHVALLAYAMPFWAVLLAWALLRDRPTRRHWVGIALAAIGLVCVIAPWEGLGSTQGTIYALLGGICWALGTIVSKKIFIRDSPDPLTFTAWQMGFGSVALIVVALCTPERAIEWSPPFIGLLAYSVLFATSLAWALWLLVVQRLPATIASISSLAVPVTSVLMAWAILAEAPSVSEWIGIAFVVAGLVAVTGMATRRAPN